MEFSFDKGSDVIIRVDGDILGGVTKLRRTVRSEAQGIYEFLTDRPVARLPRQTYILELWLKGRGGCVFENEIHTVTVTAKGKTEAYTGCAVTSLQCTALPRGDVEYAVTVEAEERSVANE